MPTNLTRVRFACGHVKYVAVDFPEEVTELEKCICEDCELSALYPIPLVDDGALVESSLADSWEGFLFLAIRAA